jgi:hypothetical protein
LELLDLTIGDPRWKGRRKELTRVRELLCDAMLGGKEYGSDLGSLDRYFYPFAVAARAGRILDTREAYLAFLRNVQCSIFDFQLNIQH